MPREGHHRRAHPIQTADEVCRGELGKSRNKKGRRSRDRRNHKVTACFYRVKILGPASKVFEAQGRDGSPDLLELEKRLAGAGQARRNRLARKKARDKY